MKNWVTELPLNFNRRRDIPAIRACARSLGDHVCPRSRLGRTARARRRVETLTSALAVPSADGVGARRWRDRVEGGRSECARRLRSARSVVLESAWTVHAVNGCRPNWLLVAAGAKGRAEAAFPACDAGGSGRHGRRARHASAGPLQGVANRSRGGKPRATQRPAEAGRSGLTFCVRRGIGAGTGRG
jgi:hypothetical protein